jgi:hypothetical protein
MTKPNLEAPQLEFAMRIEADLEVGQPIDEGMQIVNVPGGRVEGPGVSGEIVPPTADWLGVDPDGLMRLDVRMSVKMENGDYIYITYTGRIVPNDALAQGIESGNTVQGSDIYFVNNPVVRTGSKKYGWMNKAMFVGRNASVRFASEEKLGQVVYEVYKVNV